jgi:demethylmenaquinone methyltransferase/2-methoxy-6-polyprenyl-1,4-benzoquinol methylase
MTENKKHWYDGLFYDRFIAPNQDKSYKIIRKMIERNSSLLDAGCGTGRFSFQMSDKCSHVTGVDLSIKNIAVAETKLKTQNSNNITFVHTSLDNFLKNRNDKFDYSVISYVLHEMDEQLREKTLKLLAEYSKSVIVIEYLVPRPKNFLDLLNEVVEFVAGRDHYNNFKSFVKNEGMNGLAEKVGLKIIKEIKNNPSTAHIVLLSKE